MIRVLKYALVGYAFLLIVQIRVHDKTIERHVMEWPFSAWLSTQVDRAAHEAWRLAGILVRHGGQVYREVVSPHSVPVQEAKR
jgi:hypothetical protein